MNPAKVGDAALSLIFKSHKSKNWETKVSISKEDVRLGVIMDGQCKNYLKLWGIEPGLVSVEIKKEEQGSIAELLNKKFRAEDLERFSHIIIIVDWCSTVPYVQTDSETVDIYRLTPHAKMIIGAQNW